MLQETLIKVNKNPKLKKTLTLLSYLTVILSVLLLVFVMTVTLIKSLKDGVIIGVSSASAFIIVTLARRLINRKRPYEIYDFYEVAPKEKLGKSFPSRHVFSIFLIATVSFCLSPAFTAVFAALGVFLATVRVLLGIHFISDVVAGAILGILSGAIPLLLINLL